jgi:hypothetical protein
VVLISLAIGPFTQQAIKSVPCTVAATGSNNTATIPIAKYVTSDQIFRIGSGLYELGYFMKAAIISSLTNPGGNLNAVVPNCPSGECTFEEIAGITHSSMGLCSKCVDARKYVAQVNKTDVNKRVESQGQLVSTNQTYNYTVWQLPEGSGLTVPTSGPAVYLDLKTGYLDYIASELPQDMLKMSVANISIASYTINGCRQNGTAGSGDRLAIFKCSGLHPDLPDLDNNVNVVATACTLYPCMRQYRGDVTRGIFSEYLVDTSPTMLTGGYTDSYPQISCKLVTCFCGNDVKSGNVAPHFHYAL